MSGLIQARFYALMFSFSSGQYRIDVIYPNYESMLAARRQYEGEVLHEGDLVEFERRSCSLQITRPIIPRFVAMKINYEFMTVV